MTLHIGLHILFQLLRRLVALCQHNSGLNHLSTDRIRRARNGAFQHVRQFHDYALDFERPDPVAGGFNNIVGTANIPEVAVLIPPRGVAGVINIVVPHGFCQLRIFVIPVEHTARLSIPCPQHDLSYGARLHGIALIVN